MPEIHRYVLELPEPERNALAAPCTVAIAVFSISPAYAGTNLIYQESPYELKTYHYHTWATSPEQMIRRELTSYLKKRNSFQRVFLYRPGARYDIAVEGTVLRILEYDAGNEWYGILEMELNLRRWNEKIPFWTQLFKKQIPVRQKSPRGVVQAISEAVHQIADSLEAQILSSCGSVKAEQ
jgi:ABC-type uncharacterized transport system auxiliary subunit